jgi:hypothetical protein
MAEVKIYKITRTRAYMMDEVGEGYSLEPWGGNNMDYEGYDDGGKMYVLPDDYEVAQSKFDDMHIYNNKGDCCPLIKQYNSPAIVDSDKIVMLRSI